MKIAKTLEALTHTHTQAILVVIDKFYSFGFSAIKNIDEVVNTGVVYNFFLCAKNLYVKKRINLGHRVKEEKYIILDNCFS